jgi:hypothetical protein
MPIGHMENSSIISLINMSLAFDPIDMMNSNIGKPSVKLHFVSKLGYWSKVY